MWLKKVEPVKSFDHSVPLTKFSEFKKKMYIAGPSFQTDFKESETIEQHS